MRLILALSIILLSVPLHSHAFAGDVYDIGEPDAITLGTETEGYADIYTRQLKYRKSANEFREIISQRQKDFHAPAIETRTDYDAQLKELEKHRGTAAKTEEQ